MQKALPLLTCWHSSPKSFIINFNQTCVMGGLTLENPLSLIVAVIAFIFAASLIPMSKRKMRGKGVQMWRIITMALLVAAALLTMFAPALNGK